MSDVCRSGIFILSKHDLPVYTFVSNTRTQINDS